MEKYIPLVLVHQFRLQVKALLTKLSDFLSFFDSAALRTPLEVLQTGFVNGKQSRLIPKFVPRVQALTGASIGLTAETVLDTGLSDARTTRDSRKKNPQIESGPLEEDNAYHKRGNHESNDYLQQETGKLRRKAMHSIVNPADLSGLGGGLQYITSGDSHNHREERVPLRNDKSELPHTLTDEVFPPSSQTGTEASADALPEGKERNDRSEMKPGIAIEAVPQLKDAIASEYVSDEGISLQMDKCKLSLTYGTSAGPRSGDSAQTKIGYQNDADELSERLLGDFENFIQNLSDLLQRTFSLLRLRESGTESGIAVGDHKMEQLPFGDGIITSSTAVGLHQWSANGEALHGGGTVSKSSPQQRQNVAPSAKWTTSRETLGTKNAGKKNTGDSDGSARERVSFRNPVSLEAKLKKFQDAAWGEWQKQLGSDYLLPPLLPAEIEGQYGVQSLKQQVRRLFRINFENVVQIQHEIPFQPILDLLASPLLEGDTMVRWICQFALEDMKHHGDRHADGSSRRIQPANSVTKATQLQQHLDSDAAQDHNTSAAASDVVSYLLRSVFGGDGHTIANELAKIDKKRKAEQDHAQIFGGGGEATFQTGSSSFLCADDKDLPLFDRLYLQQAGFTSKKNFLEEIHLLCSMRTQDCVDVLELLADIETSLSSNRTRLIPCQLFQIDCQDLELELLNLVRKRIHSVLEAVLESNFASTEFLRKQLEAVISLLQRRPESELELRAYEDTIAAFRENDIYKALKRLYNHTLDWQRFFLDDGERGLPVGSSGVFRYRPSAIATTTLVPSVPKYEKDDPNNARHRPSREQSASLRQGGNDESSGVETPGDSAVDPEIQSLSVESAGIGAKNVPSNSNIPDMEALVNRKSSRRSCASAWKPSSHYLELDYISGQPAGILKATDLQGVFQNTEQFHHLDATLKARAADMVKEKKEFQTRISEEFDAVKAMIAKKKEELQLLLRAGHGSTASGNIAKSSRVVAARLSNGVNVATLYVSVQVTRLQNPTTCCRTWPSSRRRFYLQKMPSNIYKSGSNILHINLRCL